MIKAYIFDMDGVLIDNSKSDPKIYGETYENISENTGKSIEEVKKEMKSGYPNSLSLEFYDWNTKILKLGGTVKLEELHKKYSDLIKAYSEVKQTIRELKSRKKIICFVSNGYRVFQEIKLHATGLQNSFDFVFTADDFKAIKQDQMFWKKLMNEMKTKPREMIFVEDVESQLITAKRLGIKTVRMNRSRGKVETEADYLIHKLDEILKISG
ncbi:MAG: HAD family hydrolase [Candidatus Aenigmatarchaeota archaeon]|nr:MAG: HAD family hydrolase [Candidatus Aenigmarchaeota archaeon]